MRMKTELLLALIGAALLLAGCGAPGAPQPPSLQLPSPVADLAATRKGDKVTLSSDFMATTFRFSETKGGKK